MHIRIDKQMVVAPMSLKWRTSELEADLILFKSDEAFLNFNQPTLSMLLRVP